VDAREHRQIKVVLGFGVADLEVQSHVAGKRPMLHDVRIVSPRRALG
jgi:hypothetical protein